jgi:hypothetical protein
MRDAKPTACQHERIEVRLECTDCGEPIETREISRAELEAQAIDLPDRQAMSLLGSGLLGGAVPLGSTTPTDPGALPTSGVAPDGGGLTGGVDPMGLVSKLSPDTTHAGTQPYSPDAASSSQT